MTAYSFLFYGTPNQWAFLVGLVFLVIGVIKPSLLFHPFSLWLFLGEVIGKIISTFVLGLVFFLLISPIGLIFKLRRADLLSKQIKKGEKSYFSQRDEQPRSMKSQF